MYFPFDRRGYREVFSECSRQGRRAQAYMDVFTAVPKDSIGECTVEGNMSQSNNHSMPDSIPLLKNEFLP